MVLDWDGLIPLPQADDVSDIHCVTAWSRYDNRWAGVRATDLVAHGHPRAKVRHVLFRFSDGCTTNIPFAGLDDEDVMLAHAWEDAALDRRHDGPLRVVGPKPYLWKSATRVRRITFPAEDRPGFWETRGNRNHGDAWMEEHYG